jgi:hypothetical protein
MILLLVSDKSLVSVLNYCEISIIAPSMCTSEQAKSVEGVDSTEVTSQISYQLFVLLFVIESFN